MGERIAKPRQTGTAASPNSYIIARWRGAITGSPTFEERRLDTHEHADKITAHHTLYSSYDLLRISYSSPTHPYQAALRIYARSPTSLTPAIPRPSVSPPNPGRRHHRPPACPPPPGLRKAGLTAGDSCSLIAYTLDLWARAGRKIGAKRKQQVENEAVCMPTMPPSRPKMRPPTMPPVIPKKTPPIAPAIKPAMSAPTARPVEAELVVSVSSILEARAFLMISSNSE